MPSVAQHSKERLAALLFLNAKIMLVEFSALMSSASGKLNGSVAGRNKGGAYLRTKVTPINPNTSHQSLQRGHTSDISKAWSGTLNDAQRNAWTSYGQDFGATTRFGNGMILSGMATFQAVNKVIAAAGGTRLDSPPTNKLVPALQSLTLTANHTGPVLTVAFTPTPLVTPNGLYLFATPALSPGVGNVSTRLRFIGFFDAAATGLDILAAWQTRFGTFPTVAGQRIAISARILNLSTGALSAATGTGTLVI